MAKIVPKITFKKEKFLFGKDTAIEGSVELPGIDMASIKSVTLEHAVWYGISDNPEKDLEGFSFSKKKLFHSQDIPLDGYSSTLGFSIPLVMPNVRKSTGISFDGMYYSLIQNQIVVTVREKSIMTLSDEANAIVPIEWEIFDDEKVNLGKLITDLEENPEIEEAFALEPPRFALADSQPAPAVLDQERIALPWDESDTVSKAYYASVLNSGILAKLGDRFSRPPFPVLSGLSILPMFLLPWLMGQDIVSVPVGGGIFIGIVVYLVLSQVSKVSLRKKMDFGAYLPKIDQSNLASNMKRQKLPLRELFERYETLPSSPIRGKSGTLSVNLSFENHFAYNVGKTTNTHIQMLLNDTFFTREFSSVEAILDSSEISVPVWFGQSSALMAAKGPSFVRKISVAICYDDFPDHTVTVGL